MSKASLKITSTQTPEIVELRNHPHLKGFTKEGGEDPLSKPSVSVEEEGTEEEKAQMK